MQQAMKHPDYYTLDMKHARRLKTAKRLAAFDTETPKRWRGRGVGPLVYAGYLERKGDGYVRTAKEFNP